MGIVGVIEGLSASVHLVDNRDDAEVGTRGGLDGGRRSDLRLWRQ
jgi:hypothetical protein